MKEKRRERKKKGKNKGKNRRNKLKLKIVKKFRLRSTLIFCYVWGREFSKKNLGGGEEIQLK